MESSKYKVDSTECEYEQYSTNVNLAGFEGDVEPDHTCPKINAIFENDVTESDDKTPYGFVADIHGE
jgi:hypothetical protein